MIHQPALRSGDAADLALIDTFCLAKLSLLVHLRHWYGQGLSLLFLRLPRLQRVLRSTAIGAARAAATGSIAMLLLQAPQLLHQFGRRALPAVAGHCGDASVVPRLAVGDARICSTPTVQSQLRIIALFL